MILRVISVWVAVVASAFFSLFCASTAAWAQVAVERFTAGKPLAAISALFYEAGIIYWYPVPLLVWALVFTIWGRGNPDHAALIRVTALGVSLVFLAAFIFGMALPFLPMRIGRLNG